MKNLCLAFAVLCLTILGAQAKNYAVLVAGSNYFYNYRHQSDVFHAYQNLIKNGFDKANIITFAYDDIANDPQNPFPGQVFNKPTTGKGEDVYAGVVIDYKGADVTPKNFLNALLGDSEANKGKKVLQSTADDNVFIYFADHGATGLIAFPSEYLYADDLIKTLKQMNTDKKYKELVFYIEACESGSMFNQVLPENINIYATTAANPDESSWAYYCSPNDTVNGKSIGSCLGDEYSIHFLENWDSSDPTKETLLEQFNVVKKETLESHVQQYGDLKIDSEVIGHFESNGDGYRPTIKKAESYDITKISTVSSRHVKLNYLQNKHEKHQSDETRQALYEEMMSIEKLDTTFGGVSDLFKLNVKAPVENINFACLKERVALYEETCGKFSDYGLKYVKYIHYTCTQGVDDYDFESALVSLC